MARPGKLRELKEEVPNLEQHILTQLDKHAGKQKDAAKELGISEATLNQWLKANGYVRVIHYKKSKGKTAS